MGDSLSIRRLGTVRYVREKPVPRATMAVVAGSPWLTILFAHRVLATLGTKGERWLVG
jgi:hypothetical protein